jgi:flagellar assembly factor FliW
MIIKTRRFGELEINQSSLVSFPKGLIGFPEIHDYVLIRRTSSDSIGWLQAVDGSDLALPVVSAHAFSADYPDVPLADAAAAVGLGSDLEELSVLAVLTAMPRVPPTVNLLAPIVINATTLCGAQVLLEGSRFTTREQFVPPAPPQATLVAQVASQSEATVGGPGASQQSITAAP